MFQHLKKFWWLAGIPLLVIALFFSPLRTLLGVPAFHYNIATGFWAYALLHLIGVLSLLVWLPFKIHRGHYIRALFVGLYGVLLICLSFGRADFLPRTENLTLFRVYQSPNLSYEKHIINLVLRRGDWITFEEECVRPLRVADNQNIIGGNAPSSYCKSLGQIELAYGIRARDILDKQYATMRAIANNISHNFFDYQKCLAAKRCLVVGNDRMAIATGDRALNTGDLWCYKADACIILPILIRNENEAAFLPIPAAGEVAYSVHEVYRHFEEQPFFTPLTCQFNPMCSLMQLVGAPIK